MGARGHRAGLPAPRPRGQDERTKDPRFRNHDACWTGHRKQGRARRASARYLDAGFEQVHDSGVVYGHRVAGIPVVLSHLPYAGDHEPEDRYADRRSPDKGMAMLCGHVHNAWQTNGRMINVGVDVNDYFPVAESAIAEMLRQVP